MTENNWIEFASSQVESRGISKSSLLVQPYRRLVDPELVLCSDLKPKLLTEY